MKKLITKEHKEKMAVASKAQKSRSKHLFDIVGYEVWVDDFNFTAVKKGNNYQTYYPNLNSLLFNINRRKQNEGLEADKTIQETIEILKKCDKIFEDNLKEIFNNKTSLLSSDTETFLEKVFNILPRRD